MPCRLDLGGWRDVDDHTSKYTNDDATNDSDNHNNHTSNSNADKARTNNSFSSRLEVMSINKETGAIEARRLRRA